MKSATAQLSTGTPINCWGDLFADPDTVGSSEHRTLHEHAADVLDIPGADRSLFGVLAREVDPARPLSREELKQLRSTLGEISERATALVARIDASLSV